MSLLLNLDLNRTEKVYKDKFVSAIITAAGSGSRMEAGIPKLELEINNKPLITYTVEVFTSMEVFDQIILLASQELLETYKTRYKDFKNLQVVLGGTSREETTYLGLKALDPKSDLVVCHDGARPLVDSEIILQSLTSASEFGSGIAAVKVKDTIKFAENNIVQLTPNRNKLYQVQTPQTFKTDLILKAYKEFFGKVSPTDDSSYLEFLDEEVHLVDGSYKNIKITTKEDLLFAKMLMEEK